MADNCSPSHPMPSKVLIAQIRARAVVMAASGRVKKPRTKIPRTTWPEAARVQYTAALLKVVAELERQVEQRWLPLVPSLLARSPAARVVRDAAADDLDALDPTVIVREIDQAFSLRILARAAAEDVASHNKQQLNKQFSAGLGFDLLQSEPYLDDPLEIYAADNARLVKGLAAEQADKLKGIIARAVRTNADLKSVTAQIEKQLEQAKSRAALLARDQVGSLNAELTRLRQQHAGVEEYEWRTVEDERVRPGHRALDRTTHKWDEPPVEDPRTGHRAHPGEAVNCRCSAVPVLTGLRAGLQAA